MSSCRPRLFISCIYGLLILAGLLLAAMPERKCKFSSELKEKFPCFRSGRDDFEAECLVCRAGTYVSVANKGAADLQSHVETEKHKKAVRGETSSAKLTNFFVKPGSKVEDSVTAAEGTFAFHTVKHHFSYKSMDCTSALFKKTFPDCDVVRKFSSARTKTEAIVNSVLAPYSVESVLKTFEEHDIAYCGVSTDGSNHGSIKIFPVIIQYFDWRNGGLQSKIIEIQNVPDETADTIANYVKNTLQKKGLFDKCIAFTGDNCNTNFGGLRRDADGNNVFANLKRLLHASLIGVGCSAHILNNCIHHAAERMSVDIENIIFKIYQYFHIYTVRTEKLKEYCEFVDIEYRTLLSHSKTRWLSLFPGITRLLQMFPALQSFFLSQDKPPTLLKTFFENEFSEIYLWHLHSLMSVFQSNIQEIERENNSVVEVLKCLNTVHTILLERESNKFMSLKVKGLLAQKHKEGYVQECDTFCAEVDDLYSTAIDYLQKWIRPLDEFSCFTWMALGKTPEWKEVESCVKFLLDKGVQIDDVKCFDQFSNLKKFTESLNGDQEFHSLLAHQKWTKYISQSKCVECHSELLNIAQFFFAIPSHNANVERVFSLMQSQWTKERNNLTVESVKGILLVQYNFRDTSCHEFNSFLRSNQALLKKMRSTEKYAWANETPS